MNSFSIWFRGLRGKLLFLVALPVVVLTASSLFAYTKLSYLADKVEQGSTVRLPIAQLSGDMDSSVNAVVRFMWAALSAEGNKDERAKSVKRLNEELTRFKYSMEEYLKMPRTDKMKEMFKPVQEAAIGFIAATQEVAKLAEKGSPKDDEEGKSVLREKVRPYTIIIGKTLDEMDQTRKETARLQAEEDRQGAESARNLLMTICIVSSLALLFFGVLIASKLAQTLTFVTQRISDSGAQVSSASEQLSSASQSLSSGATEAASSLEETVSSLEELSSMVKLNADNAKEASSLSLSSRKSAEDGESEIKSLISAMTDISQSSKKIEEIINVIDDIAFQTNLLALNAAVEAARAGEQGKGFAVVAEAVRNLAQRSASAAKDITVLIKESVDKISNGSKIADQSGEVLKNIVTSVKKVSDLNNEIASASAEQSNGISQISKAMNELDQATQRNAASAEETAASSEEMSAQAIELQGLVSDLSSVIDGSTTPRAEPQSAPRGGRPTGGSKPVAKLKVFNGGSTGGSASKAIPFDDDHASGKVGTTDGF